jgi:hypothetical protein
MNYHWESKSADVVVLFEEGATWTRLVPMPGMAAAIHKMGPFLGNPKVRYRTSGLIVNLPKEFDSVDEAKKAVEAIARAAGHTINGAEE